MTENSFFYSLIPLLLPFECMKAHFMQQALLGLLLLSPMTALLGVQVVNSRMAFFSDAVSHSAFAGAALALIFSTDPELVMPVFGVLVGLSIVAVRRGSGLSPDTVIGVFFSGVVAFGIAVVSREKAVAGGIQSFLYGDILTIGDGRLVWLSVLLPVILFFQIFGYNRILLIGINSTLASAHRVRTAQYQYLFAGLLALTVMTSVGAVGVLLVTAMLIVPAAAARNLARTAGRMPWWAVVISMSSSIAGLIISAQDWAGTATGATIILVCCLWFVVSAAVASMRKGRPTEA